MESNNPNGSSRTVLTLYEEEHYAGNMKEFGEDCKECKDVTKFLPGGASSIVVSKDTGTWQVFTELSFRGTSAKLEANGQYQYPSDMRLQKPVKSFRKAP